jgi:hypothetical protein
MIDKQGVGLKGSAVIWSRSAPKSNGPIVQDSDSGLTDSLEAKMPDEEWIKTLEDGRKVKFIYQELPEDGAFITAQVASSEVVYSIVLARAGNPLSREDVESRFKRELSKK